MASVMKRIQSNLQLRLSGAERLDDDVENLDGSPNKTGRTRAIAELKLQVKLAAPVVLGYLLQMMLNLVRLGAWPIAKCPCGNATRHPFPIALLF